MEINITGIPDDIGFEINGSKNVTIVNKLVLYLNNTIDVDTSNVNVSFGFHVTGGNGSLLFNITNHDKILELGYIHVNIVDLFNMTLQGSINVSRYGDTSGVLNMTVRLMANR